MLKGILHHVLETIGVFVRQQQEVLTRTDPTNTLKSWRFRSMTRLHRNFIHISVRTFILSGAPAIGERPHATMRTLVRCRLKRAPATRFTETSNEAGTSGLHTISNSTMPPVRAMVVLRLMVITLISVTGVRRISAASGAGIRIPDKEKP